MFDSQNCWFYKSCNSNATCCSTM